MLRIFLSILLVFPNLAAAKPVQYLCEITEIQENESWFPQQTIFFIDLEQGSVTAFDGLINYVYEAPVAADLKVLKDNSWQIKWKVVGIPIISTYNAEGFIERRFSNKTNARFRVLMNPETKTYAVRGVSGSVGVVRGSGTCRKA